MLDARGRLLRAAPGFVTLRSALRDPSREALHRYLDAWRGVGAIAPGMAHQDFDWSGEDVVEAISMLLTSHTAATGKRARTSSVAKDAMRGPSGGGM